jgi:uncharacterized membrane protein YfcA
MFLAGLVDAIAGGGGVISLSAYIAAGFPAHLALGTNKFSSIFGTAISLYEFAKKGHIKWRSAIYSAIGALIGSWIGAQIALMLSERTINVLVLIIIPLVTLFLIIKRDFGEFEKDLPTRTITVYSVLVGCIIGCYDGFFGPGSGTFLIIAFSTLLGFSLLTANGNAKVVNFASNLAAVFTFAVNGNIDYKISIGAAVCGIAGSYIGAKLALSKGSKVIRPMMLVVISLLLLKIVWDLIQM